MKEIKILLKQILEEANTGEKIKVVSKKSGSQYQVTKDYYDTNKGLYKLPDKGVQKKDSELPKAKPKSKSDSAKNLASKVMGGDKPKPQKTKNKNNVVDNQVNTENYQTLNDLLHKTKNLDQAKKAEIALDSVKSELKKLTDNPNNPNKNSHKQALLIFSKIVEGQNISDSQSQFLSSWVKIAQPTTGADKTCKIYIAREPNSWKRTSAKGAIKVEMGGRRGAKSKFYGIVANMLKKSGLGVVKTTSFGGKLTTANQTYTDEAGKTKLIPVKTEVKRTSQGKVQSVKIGDTNIKYAPTDQPGLDEQQILKREINNRNLEKYAESIQRGDLSFIDMDDGVVPNTPQNRVTVIQGALTGMSKRLLSLTKQGGITDKATLKLITDLEEFAKLDPNNDPQKWHKTLNAHMSNIANHDGKPSLKQAWANFAEIYVAIDEMQGSGTGTQNGKCALLPQSTNLKTVDVLTITDKGSRNNIVTLNGISVKAGKGGASALYSKVQSSQFKNDKNGKLKKNILNLAGSYTDIFSVDMGQNLKSHKTSSQNYTKEVHNKALNCGVQQSVIDDIEAELLPPKSGDQAVNSALMHLKQERQKAGMSVSPEDMAKIKLRLENYYRFVMLASYAYNKNLLVQDFTNNSVTSQKKDPGGSKLVANKDVHISMSDGIKVLAYVNPVFNGGFRFDGQPNNPGAGRFVNSTVEQYSKMGFSRRKNVSESKIKVEFIDINQLIYQLLKQKG